MTEPKPNCQYHTTCHAANCDGCENCTPDDRVNALEHELGALIARYQAVLGENVQLARALAEHDGHSEPPHVDGELRTSGMKLVLTRRKGYRLANYWQELGGWLESWTMNPLDEVVRWWELPGGER